MRLLWVKAGKLLPVDTGGKIRSYNLLRQLAKRHEVTLLSYYGRPLDHEYERELAEKFPGAISIATAAPASQIGEALGFARHLLSAAPYAVAKFTSRSVKRKVAELLNGGGFDAAVCDFLAASLNFPRSSATPTLLFQHNVESALWERQARHESNMLRRLAYRIEAAKMARYEAAAVRQFDHIIAVSRHDRDLMGAMTAPSRISVVPTGVDIEQYRKAGEARGQRSEVGGQPAEDADREARPLVVFTGSMDWEANIDGAEYFCREVWPLVLGAVPEARFRIVGRNPHPRVTRLASDSVEVTGTVPSIIGHLREAAVVVVPLRIGGGTRLKIYEAMAMEKAVVSTTIGAEGLDVNHGRDILLEDSPETFAGALIRLLNDSDQRRRIETAAARQASQFDWPVVARQFEEVLTRVVAAQGQGAGVGVGLPDTVTRASGHLASHGSAPAHPTTE